MCSITYINLNTNSFYLFIVCVDDGNGEDRIIIKSGVNYTKITNCSYAILLKTFIFCETNISRYLENYNEKSKFYH